MRSDKVKRKFKKIINKFKEKLFIADLLLIISFFIFFFTTFSLNKYVAMYLLGIGIFLLSYFVQKKVNS
nr:hypothetical protein [Clostridium perfringens]